MIPATGHAPKPVYTWYVDDKKVLLIETEQQLICLLKHRFTKTEERHVLPPIFSEYKHEEYYPVIKSKSAVEFAPHLHVWKNWGNTAINIALLFCSDRSLMWHVWDPAHKTGTQFPAPIDPNQDRVKFITNLKPSRSLLEDRKASSLLNSSVKIGSQNYGLTLISAGRDWYGHAMIAIEGVNNGIPFLWYIDLINAGNINKKAAKGINSAPSNSSNPQVRLIERRYIQPLGGKTETWLRTKEKVERLLKRVRWEIERQEKDDPRVFFCLSGSDSYRVQPVRVKKEFKKLEDCRDFFRDNPPLEEDMKLSFGNNSLVSGECYLGKSKSIIIKFKKNIFKNRIHDLEDLEIFIKPDNCITYARKRLSLCQVELPNITSGGIGTFPTTYVSSGGYFGGLFNYFSRYRPGQERLQIFTEYSNRVHSIDLTEEIQRQIGANNLLWRLTEDSIVYLNTIHKPSQLLSFIGGGSEEENRLNSLFQGVLGLENKKVILYRDFLELSKKFEISIHIDKEIIKVDLTIFLKEQIEKLQATIPLLPAPINKRR